MTDFNRIPKMLYKMYSACWNPFSVKPVVYLAHHWNRTGAVRVNAFSNCPGVELFINGASQGVKTPNPWNGTGDDFNIGETNTELPYQCYWDVTWASGTLLANGLDANGKVVCSDQKQTAGNADHIVLVVDTPVVKPNGFTFQITANGTDAAIILAKVVDANGITCPTASNIITFAVSGPGNYRGGSDALVTTGQPLGYHSPLDPNLSAEGGMCKAAVRSTFITGVVTVTATSPGLGTGTATFTVAPVTDGTSVLRPAARSVVLERTAQVFNAGFAGGMIKYYMSVPAMASIDILDAGGKILQRIPRSRCGAGWHPIQISGAKGSGVYLVRISADGASQFVKPVVVMR